MAYHSPAIPRPSLRPASPADLRPGSAILPTFGPGAPGEPLTMSSLEIAELLGARHDNVKVTVERLANRGTIEFPATQDIPTATKPVRVYRLDKRSSLIVVAQLSPEFTARVVDRWQELEAPRAHGGAGRE